MIQGNGFNMPTSGFSNAMDGWNSAEDRRERRRSEMRKSMLELADMAANQGLQIGMDDWAQQVSSMLSPNDFLTSSAPSAMAIDTIRQAQNAKAKKVDEDRQRQMFRAELEDSRLIEDEIAKRALSGQSTEEIAVSMRDSFGEKADKFIPRVAAVANNAMMNERLTMEQKFADTFEDEGQAQEFVKSNPGLTKSAQEGIINAGRKAAIKREDAIHNSAVQIAAKIGDSLGYVGDDQIRSVVDAFVPPSTKPEVRQRILEKVGSLAKASQQAGLASSQAKSSIEVASRLAAQAPEIARVRATLELDEQARIQKAQEMHLAGGMATAAAQDKRLADMEQDAIKLKTNEGRKRATAIAETRKITGTYHVSNVDDLLDAVSKGDMARVERIKATSPTRDEYNAKLSAGAAFLKGPAFQSQAEMVSALNPLLPSEAKTERFGKEFRNSLDLSVPSSGNKTQEQAAAGLEATGLRDKFITSTADQVINSVNTIIAQSGRVNMTPQEMAEMSRGLARRYASSFLRGAGLQNNSIGQNSVDALTAEIMARVTPPAGSSVRVNPVDAFNRNLRQIASDNLLTPTSYTTPGAAMPSPRVGVPQSNQWWNPGR